MKVIIVSGASRGIGHAIARELLATPATNVVILARSESSLNSLKGRHPSRVEVVAGDAADETLGQSAVAAAVGRWGRVDGLVVNHGQVEPVARIADADLNEWRSAFEVNVFSAVAMVRAALPELRKTQGCIVLTSSGAAVKGTPTWGCYGAAKAVLNHLALTLEKEEPLVTTVAIRPGVVDTQMQATLASTHFAVMEKEDADRFRALKADGKMLRPEQPGQVMARLVLAAPQDLSGKFLNWDDEKLAFLGRYQ